MNAVTTAVLLIFTLLAALVASYFFGAAPGPGELDALRTLLWILGCAWMATFVTGELTGNVSQVNTSFTQQIEK